MDDPRADEFADLTGWTRRRIVLLSISAAGFVALMIAVQEILLPFLLGIVIAYVLLPLVSLGERWLKLPRSVSIVSVYVVVLSAVYLLLATLAPRLFVETARLAQDAPSMLRRAAETYGPAIDRRVNDYLHQQQMVEGGSFGSALVPEGTASPKATAGVPSAPPSGSQAPEGATPALGPTPAELGQAETLQKQQAAFVIRPLSDGAFVVELAAGVDVHEESPGHFRIAERERLSGGRFRITELLADGVERFLSYVEGNAAEFVKLGQTIVTRAARGVFLLFMVLMVAGYLMHTHEVVIGFFRSLVPSRHRASFGYLLTRMDRGLSGVVRGQLIICVVNGLLSALGFWLFDLHYWPVLALVAGAMSIIPIFGAILSTVPAVMVGLTQDLWTAVWVSVWILGIHQVEANILNPKIIGAAAKIHPVPVVFSLLVGEHYFGIWGALLAVPVLSLTQSIFNHFRFGLPDASPDSLRPLAPPSGRGL